MTDWRTLILATSASLLLAWPGLAQDEPAPTADAPVAEPAEAEPAEAAPAEAAPAEAAAAPGSGAVASRDPQNAWPLPEADACNPKGGLLAGGAGSAEDAPPSLPFAPGDVFSLEQIEVLKHYIPDFLWNQRERFFYEGMRLEIGPCFRDYGAARASTQEAGEGQRRARRPARPTKRGLRRTTSPVSPSTRADIDSRPTIPCAGTKWLWNIQHRYQGGRLPREVPDDRPRRTHRARRALRGRHCSRRS